MTRIEALKDLLAKVEAGDVLQAIDTVDVFPMSPAGDVAWLHACKSSQGSLDAAKALHEAVLTGWLYSIENEATCVFTDNILNAEFGRCDDNPARAWLIAILKALIAQEYKP